MTKKIVFSITMYHYLICILLRMLSLPMITTKQGVLRQGWPNLGLCCASDKGELKNEVSAFALFSPQFLRFVIIQSQHPDKSSFLISQQYSEPHNGHGSTRFFFFVGSDSNTS